MNIEELVSAHRISVWAVISGFVGACTHIYIALTVIPFHLYCAFRVGRAVHLSSTALIPVLVLMLFPVVNTLALLLLNNKASRALKAAGIPMGLMGFKRENSENVNYSLEMLKAARAKESGSNIPLHEEKPKD